MVGLIGALRISLGMETAAFSQGMELTQKQIRRAVRDMEKFGDSVQSLGNKLSLAVTLPLVGLGKVSIDAAMESRDALAQVEATLTSVGNAAGRSAEQLQDLASDQMHKSLYDDDEILRKVTTSLLTFNKVSGDTFDRAQQAAVDLSAKFGNDLQASAVMVGKALQDPVKGITALRRVGISFTQQQIEQVKAMVAVGNVAGAQKLILAELEHQVSGSAAAAARANPFSALKHSLDDFQEAVGGVLLDLLPPITNALNNAVSAFNKLPPAVQGTAVKAGLLAAALGPVVSGLGGLIKLTAPFTAMIGLIGAEGGILAGLSAGFAGLAAVLGPVLVPLAAVAAAGVLIYANWDKIAPVLKEVWTAAQSALGPPLRQMVTDLTAALTQLWNGPLGQGLRGAIQGLADFAVAATKATTECGPLTAAIKLLLQAFTSLMQVMPQGLTTLARLLDGDFKGAAEAFGATINAVFLGIPGIVGRMVEGVREWIVTKLGRVWDWLNDKILAVTGWFRDMATAVVLNSYVPDMVDGIAEQMKRLDAVMVAPAKAATAKTADAFKKLAADVQPLLERLFPESAAKNANTKDYATLEAAQRAGMLDKGQLATALERLQNSYFNDNAANSDDKVPAAIQGWDDALVDLKAYSAAFGQFTASVTAAIPDMSKATGIFADISEGVREMKDDLARSFTDVVLHGKNLGDALVNVFDRFSTRLLDNLFNNLFDNIFSGSGGLLKGIGKLFGFAEGTDYAPRGLAMVGERGPELMMMRGGEKIIPNHELGSLGGTTTVQVIPSAYFDVVVDGRIQRAAPAISQAGSDVAMRNLSYRQSRTIGG